MRRALILVPLFALLLAGCGQPKKPVPDSGWRKGPIDYRVSEEPPDPCPRKYNSIPQEWQGGYPAAPEEVLAILSPGHGPMGNRGDQGECVDEYGNKQNLPTVNGKNKIQEDELTMALALRMHAFLKRAGFISELIRTGQYGTEGDCPQLALFRKSPRKKVNNKEWCGDPGSKWARSGEYLSIRGRSDILNYSLVKKLCGNDPSCIKDVWLPNKGKAISRAAQIVRDHAPTLGIVFDPDNDNFVDSLKVVYISLHFNYVGRAANNTPTILAMYSDLIRNPNGKGTVPNPALTFQSGNHELDSVKKNYVTSLFEYMVFSTRSVLKEARDKTSLHYINIGEHVGSNPGHRPSSTFYSQNNGPPRGPLKGEKIAFGMNAPGQNVGTVTVVSGIDPDRGFQPNRAVIAIPNNVTLEVANYLDCRNVSALLRSLTRTKNSNFDPDVTPPDSTDPIDVAAEDIAHGLVEYYESYVPGFKQKACENLKNSDWKDHMPDWCTSGGGGGGGGANVPDIDDVRPDRIEVDVWMTDGAANPPVEVSFGNVGTADLLATISTDSPIASIGPPDVYPAGTAAPLGGSQSVSVPPGERARVEVGFRCTEVGDHTGSIAIRSNDPDEPEVDLPMVVHCLSGMYISVGGYDIEKGMFYKSYYDPTTDTDERFYVPEITAVNFVLAADSGWAELSRPEFGFGFTAYNDEYEQLEYWLETPEWLTLTPDRGVLEPDGVYGFVNVEAQGFCDGPEEKNGFITIHSNDRWNPSIRIPVRLMCGEIEAEYDPKVYNSMEEPLTEWCDRMHGRGVVKGADHLKELYLEIVYEDIDWEHQKPVGIEFRTPKMSYLFVKDDWSSLRWPQISGDWSWDEHPIFRFYSWTSSCAFDVGTYEVRDFEYGMFKLPSAGTVTIENNAFPGAVYNLAELCVSGSCSPLKVKHKIEGDDQPTRELELEHGLWERSTHSFVAGYHYDVEFLNGDVLVDTASRRIGAFFERDKIIYCTGFVRLNNLRTRDGSSVSLTEPTVYPRSLFWGHVVEYDYEDRTSYVTETLGGAWCYTPWDRQGTSAENGELQQAAPPWERGIKPQWVPGELLFCQQEDCDGYRLEIDDADTPSDR